MKLFQKLTEETRNFPSSMKAELNKALEQALKNVESVDEALEAIVNTLEDEQQITMPNNVRLSGHAGQQVVPLTVYDVNSRTTETLDGKLIIKWSITPANVKVSAVVK